MWLLDSRCMLVWVDHPPKKVLRIHCDATFDDGKKNRKNFGKSVLSYTCEQYLHGNSVDRKFNNNNDAELAAIEFTIDSLDSLGFFDSHKVEIYSDSKTAIRIFKEKCPNNTVCLEWGERSGNQGGSAARIYKESKL